MEVPSYVTFLGALEHIYLLALGEFNLDDYKIGDGSDSWLLHLLFVTATFFLLVHLLNMLIAIMGETFAKFNEVRHQQNVRNHLRFVVDNMWRDPLEEQRAKITHLVVAYLVKHHEDDVLGQLREEIK